MSDKIEFVCGTSINEAANFACARTALTGKPVSFDFNGLTLTATLDTSPAKLVQAYREECDRRSREYASSPEYKARQEESARKERERAAKVRELLARAPAAMGVRDTASWEAMKAKNSDPYGGAVMAYSERWARLMAARMAGDERLEDIAEDCSHLADEEGITGFMYGCAVSTLAAHWTHGEALRKWHNLKTQLSDEGAKANESGGVLNPALLSIGDNA